MRYCKQCGDRRKYPTWGFLTPGVCDFCYKDGQVYDEETDKIEQHKKRTKRRMAMKGDGQ